jgi:hypothetical protein
MGPPARWYPPPANSPCWKLLTICQLAAYDAHQRQLITDEELIRWLEGCKLELGWCSLLRWLKEVLGIEDPAAFVAMVGFEECQQMVEAVLRGES